MDQRQGIHLIEEVEDDITWTLLANRQYLAASTYKTEFFGAISTNMNIMVCLWNVWALSKIKVLHLACTLK
jgi:hypothetical protein